jgi:hypothetical protein
VQHNTFYLYDQLATETSIWTKKLVQHFSVDLEQHRLQHSPVNNGSSNFSLVVRGA